MPSDDVSELRRIRHEISEQCGHDIHKVAAYYRQVEDELKNSKSSRFEERSFAEQAAFETTGEEDL